MRMAIRKTVSAPRRRRVMRWLAPLRSRALAGAALLAFAAAGFAAFPLLGLAQFAAAALVGLGLAGGDRVEAGAGRLDRQGDDVDRGSGEAAAQEQGRRKRGE